MDNVIVPSQQDELTAMLAEAGLISEPAQAPVEEEILVTDEEIEGLEAAPAEITLADEPVELADEVPGEVLDEVPGEVLDAIGAAMEIEEAKAELYAEQESEVQIEEAPAAAKPGKAPKAPRAAAAPRTPRFTGTPAEFVASKLGDELKTTVDAMAVKVKEKAVNLTEHLTVGKPLSVYTQVAIDMLKNEGVIDTKSLVAQLQVVSKKSGGLGYSIGTARSQAGQQTSLLQGFGIVRKDGGKLVPNEASPFWAKLSGAPAAA